MCNTLTGDAQIEININDLILTPLSCASLINEIIKCLVYGKAQIPYHYPWLKHVVSRKRKASENGEVKQPTNFAMERHYREVYNAYSSLEEIMNNLNKEFSKQNCTINEVMILFGATQFCAKEVFRIVIPNLAKGHFETNHLSHSQKNQQKILREIFFSQEWMSSMQNTFPPTNMFVLIKKSIKTAKDTTFFKLNRQYNVSNRINKVSICLNYTSETVANCCENLVVYEDSKQHIQEEIITEKQENEEHELQWFEATVLFKGFKDCFINKISMSKMW